MPDLLSMTGFGDGAHDAVGVQIAVVNHKGIAVQVRGDVRDLALEEDIRQAVRTALVRGSATVGVRVAGPVAGLDEQALAAAWTRLAAQARALGAPVPTLESVALLLPRGEASGAPRASVLAALDRALVQVQAARRREGAALAAALRGQALALRAVAGRMRTRAAERMPAHRQQLLDRLAEVLRGQAAVTPELLVRELAVHAERIDVTEEQVRLAAHLDELDRLLAQGAGIGRTLDFLLQEILREVNTTGSKANDAPLAALVIEAKGLIDQLKEQAANLV